MFKPLAALLFLVISSGSHWLTNLDTAEAEASKEQKLILLNFSGSDWCIPCISLHKDIFENEAFVSYADKNLVLVNADFPRKKVNRLTAEQTKLNDAMAERYNKDGVFPLTILLRSDGTVIKKWEGYYKNGVSGFIEELSQYTSHD